MKILLFCLELEEMKTKYKDEGKVILFLVPKANIKLPLLDQAVINIKYLKRFNLNCTLSISNFLDVCFKFY
jgi:hypothetical protein